MSHEITSFFQGNMLLRATKKHIEWREPVCPANRDHITVLVQVGVEGLVLQIPPFERVAHEPL